MTTPPAPVFRILVLCTGNSARSQIGEALLTTRGATRAAGVVIAESAGSHPAARVNPYAVEALANHGIAWNHGIPKHIDAVAHRSFNLVITVCDNAREACPVLPGAGVSVHWGLPDPADETDPASARTAFAQTYEALSTRVDALFALPLETLSGHALRDAATEIHEKHING